jgi:hypothetical protein
VDDPARLREVFFSGDPWLVMCAPYEGYPGNAVFESLAGNAWTRKAYRAGVIDCSAKLPASGKTVVERFRLSSQKGYNRNALAFWVANGGKPKVVPAKMLLPPQTKRKSKKKRSAPVDDVSARALALDEYVAKKVAVRYGKATNAGALKKGCLSKPKSAVVLSEGDPSAGTLAVLERLVTNHRTVKFCLVDHSKYKISVGKKSTWNKQFRGLLSSPMEDGEARLVLFLKDKKKKKKKKKDSKKSKKKKRWPSDMLQQGVTIRFLQQVLGRVKADMSAEDVCREIVRLDTKKDKIAYTELLTNEDMCDYHGNSLAGKGTHFVSYVRDEPFVELVSALDVFVNLHSLNPGRVFFWLDIFSLNQHTSFVAITQDWLTNSLPMAIR